MNSVSLQFVDYRNDPAELAARVDGMIAAAAPVTGGGDPIALIVPHAGYIYSGPVAAHAYRAVQGRSYDTVVVMGLSHRVPLRGISVLDAPSFETPLGKIPCDRELAGALTSRPGITFLPEAHGAEHSLEVQVPFIQRAMKDFRIVMAVVGSPDPAAERSFIDTVAEWSARKKILLVVSTDFSHYYSYEMARRMDGVALKSVVALDAGGLERDVRGKKCELCGINPVLTLLSGAGKLGIRRAVLLKYANSGDTAGPKDQVVGYAAVAFYGDEEEEREESETTGSSSRLGEGDRKELLEIARRSIEGAVREGKAPVPSTGNASLKAPQGAFVTIKIDGRLRGCIGNFGIGDAKPLFITVSEMAAAAALQDPRFPPLSERELSKIDIEISALTPLRPVDDVREIEVGRHGIYIRKGSRSGVLLPQVATEYGWDRDTFLRQTCRKAGLGPDEWREGASISVFEAEIFGEKEI